MIHRLRGMFAFAIWDRERKQLFLARDPMGIKPLYYSVVDGTLHFASQVKALLKVDNIDCSIDAAGQVSFYLWGAVAEPYTMYTGIKALPAGCTMTVGSDGGQRIGRYADAVGVLAGGGRRVLWC